MGFLCDGKVLDHPKEGTDVRSIHSLLLLDQDVKRIDHSVLWSFVAYDFNLTFTLHEDTLIEESGGGAGSVLSAWIDSPLGWLKFRRFPGCILIFGPLLNDSTAEEAHIGKGKPPA
jgi:hypothetical protein